MGVGNGRVVLAVGVSLNPPAGSGPPPLGVLDPLSEAPTRAMEVARRFSDFEYTEFHHCGSSARPGDLAQ